MKVVVGVVNGIMLRLRFTRTSSGSGGNSSSSDKSRGLELGRPQWVEQS